MKNFVQPGDTIGLVAPYQRFSGEGALVGAVFGVATADVASGAAGQFSIDGIFELAKTSAQAWTQGQKIYWDNVNKRCDNTVVGPLIGFATDVAANPSSVGRVKLDGEALPSSVAAEADLVDAFGVADGTIADVTAAFSQTILNNNFQDIATKINAILAKLRTAGIITP